MTLKVGVVVCGLSGVALTALASLFVGPPTIVGGEVAQNNGDRVTARKVDAPPALREISGHSGMRDLVGGRVPRSGPDTGLEDAEEVTLRATQEPMLEELALEESIVPPDPDDTDDPEMITLRASLEPVLEEPVRECPAACGVPRGINPRDTRAD